MQHECDAQVAQFTCVIEELRAKMREMEAEHKEKVLFRHNCFIISPI